MHELSVAESIFRLAEEKILQYPGKKPMKIILEIGTLAGIDFEALDFALTSMVKSTLFDQTEIEIIKIQPQARCSDCGHEFIPVDYLANCPNCGNFKIDFIKGKELLIRSIELE